MTGRDSCLKPRLTKRRGTVRNLKNGLGSVLSAAWTR